jgi:nucleoid-associated protein YgaU
MRYQFTPVSRRFDGQRVYATTYYPVIPNDASDVYIIASEQDYLDSLAKKYYGDESYWWIIATANNFGNGKLSIPVGTQVRIPGNVAQIMQTLKQVNQ